jgi:hypothetical protein
MNMCAFAGNQVGWISGIPKAGSQPWHKQAAKAVATPARALPAAKQQQPTAADSKIAYDSQGVTVPADIENLRVDANVANAALQQQAAAGSQKQGTTAEQTVTVVARKLRLAYKQSCIVAFA